MDKKEIKAIAFDIDGTLYSNARLYAKIAPFFLKHLFFFIRYNKVRKILHRTGPLPDFFEYQARLLADGTWLTASEARNKIDEIVYHGLTPYFANLKSYPYVYETFLAFKNAGLKKLGKCLIPLSQKKSTLFVAVLVLAPLIIVFQWFRVFQFYIQVILCLSAVLAVELAVRDKVLGSKCGVYENALIVDGRLLMKEDITALPTLEYEKESESFNGENGDFYRKALKIVTEKNGVIFVGFSNEAERNNAVEIIKNWVK